MGWMTCSLPFPGAGLQDRFDAVYMAMRGPKGAALFSRTSPDRAAEIFLISPAAAGIEAIRGLADWQDEPDPFAHKWAGLVFDRNDLPDLGITLGHD